MRPQALVEQLKAIREPEIRVASLVLALCSGDPAPWISAMVSIVHRVHATDDVDAAIALEAITQAAGTEALAYDARQRMYEAAASQGHWVIARLFLAASPITVSDAQAARQLAPERPLRPNGRPLTLGERKSLARTRRRDLILLMAKDPHPDVVEVLLHNPHVTEADVVHVASRRPALPETLQRVAVHPRWSARHLVKRALVWNPTTPLDVAIRLATTLRRVELRAITVDETLAPGLRTHVTELLDLLHAGTKSVL